MPKAKDESEHLLTLEIRVWDGATPEDAESALPHVIQMIRDGFTSGVICPDSETGRGWWTLKIARDVGVTG